MTELYIGYEKGFRDGKKIYFYALIFMFALLMVAVFFYLEMYSAAVSQQNALRICQEKAIFIPFN